MKLLTLTIATFLLGTAAYAQQNSETALNCRAVEIYASDFEEAFTTEEYPEVRVESINKSNPLLPSIMKEFTVSIGANGAYVKGESGVRRIRDESEDQGHQKYVVIFDDGRSITVESQHLGKSSLTSSDGSLEAELICE